MTEHDQNSQTEQAERVEQVEPEPTAVEAPAIDGASDDAPDGALDAAEDAPGATAGDAIDEESGAAGEVDGASSDSDDSDDADDADDAAPTGGKRKSGAQVLESEAEIAADYLEELLDIADLDGDIDTYIEGDRAHVSIVSDSDLLVGSNGTVLDALQELARLAVMTETGERSRLMLDVAGFREKRRSELVELAADAIDQVKTSQERVPLAPMNPFERKIVHDAVAAAGLTSASEGEEPKRHVVVLPVG
jgi:spoIIIJ-associated protein